MEPYIQDGSVAYVNRDPLASGDVGIFCVDGEMLCKQYVRDQLGMVYLFSLNRPPRGAQAPVLAHQTLLLHRAGEGAALKVVLI